MPASSRTLRISVAAITSITPPPCVAPEVSIAGSTIRLASPASPYRNPKMRRRRPTTPLSARGVPIVRSCITPFSARSSSPSEGAGAPRISASAACLKSEADGDPGGVPETSTRPVAESTVHTAAGTAAPVTGPAGVSWLPGATWTASTPGRTVRWMALGRQLASAHAAAAIAAACGFSPGPEKSRNDGVAPCCRYAMRVVLLAKV